MADRAIYSGDGIDSGKLEWRVSKHVSSAFVGDGGATNHGDFDSANTYTIWSVTGNIVVRALYGICNVDVIAGGGTATVSVGAAGALGSFITTVNADNITLNDVIGVSSRAPGSLVVSTGIHAVGNGSNIIETTATDHIDSGQIDYYIVWAPVESGSTIVDSGALSQV